MKIKDFQKIPYMRKDAVVICGGVQYSALLIWEVLKLCRAMKKLSVTQKDAKLIIEYSNFNCRGKFTINEIGLENAKNPSLVLNLEI